MSKIGDLVIFGEADAPQAHCIGRITSRDGHVWHGEYLSKRTRNWYTGGLCDRMTTPISDFGVQVNQSDGRLTVTRVGPSVATYLDGSPRDWQERLPVTIETIS